jgi:hypothetical protein
MVVIVDNETHVMFAHIDTIPQMCRRPFMYTLALSGMDISMMHVVVKPANTAACVAIAEKLSLYKFSSCENVDKENYERSFQAWETKIVLPSLSA